jgi:hypothetical protein
VRSGMFLIPLAVLALALSGLVTCASAPRELILDVVYTADTYAYTSLCGCCGGQMGGLAVGQRTCLILRRE